jgi:hypothetical protein
MPRAGRTPKPQAGQLYKAWQSFAAPNLDPAEFPAGVVKGGTLLLGDHPLVRAHPQMFVLSDSEELAGTVVGLTPAEVGRAQAGGTAAA